MTVHISLHFGGVAKPIVVIGPDARWPGMFRVVWPDAGISPVANLTRCKAAAREWAERGPPRRDPRGRWEWKTVLASEAPQERIRARVEHSKLMECVNG